MQKQRIPIVENILSANDQVAALNRKLLDDTNVFALNIMASPGAGKTSVIEATIKALRDTLKIAVIEGDIATSIDSERVQKLGVEAVQINTGGNCHLEAGMIQNALTQLDLTAVDLLLVENVGNLVCPSGWKLGTHKNILIASVPEGDDKPYKYPTMYRGVDALVLNKIDLLPYIDFDMAYFKQGIELLNADLSSLNIFDVSCRTGDGLANWIEWLREQQAISTTNITSVRV
jgi:hydrogenase nickel incorporation protein HypB